MHSQTDVSFFHKFVTTEYFGILLNFYLQLPSDKSKFIRLSTNEDKHRLSLALFQIIHRIVLFSQIPSSEIEEDKSSIVEAPNFVLPKFVLEILLKTSAQKDTPPNFFFQTLINLEGSDKPVAQMLLHLCINNIIHTQNICQVLQEGYFLIPSL